MKIRIIAPIENFELEDLVSLKYKQYTIKHGSTVIPSLIVDGAFAFQVGYHKMELINKNYIFEWIFQMDTVPIEHLNYIGRNALSQMQIYIQNLWFLEDNSCFVNHLFLQEIGGEFSRTYLQDVMDSNSIDSFPKTTFSPEVMQDYAKFFETIIPYVTVSPELYDLIPEDDRKNVGMNYMPYQYNRIYRALLFISFARKTGIIISKISSYMAAYECLFTSNNKKVTNRVTNRSSRFLGGNDDEIEKNKELVLKAYEIRSLFLHGEKIHSTPAELKDLSQAIDELTRRIMNKLVMNVPENEIFKIGEDEAGKADFEDYFTGLVP